MCIIYTDYYSCNYIKGTRNPLPYINKGFYILTYRDRDTINKNCGATAYNMPLLD